MDPVLLAVQLEPPNRGGQGDSVYRTVQPLRALGERPGVVAVSGSWLHPLARTLAETADVLVLVMTAEADLVPLVERRRARGLLTVFEVNDDALAPQAWNPTANVARDPFLRAAFLRTASLADGLQLSVAPLGERYGHLAGPSRVLVNHLWTLPEVPAREAGGKLRVGWGGSLGHRDDLVAHLPAVREVLDRHPEAVFALMGPPSFKALLDGFPAGRTEFTPGGSLEAYYRFVASLDAGLCPLVATDWNRCRSDVKWLELASHGAAPLVSRLAPYAHVRDGETGLVFGSPAELAAKLEAVLADPGLRARVAAGARAEAARRLERDHVDDRLDFWREAAAVAGRTFAPREHPELPDALRAGGHHPAPDDAATRLLHDGLVLLRDGHPAEARRKLTEATRAAPADFTPWLYLGGAEEKPARAVDALRKAAALAPGSPTVARALGLKLLAAGDASGARRELARCTDVAPALGFGEALLGELALEGGDRSGVDALRAACRANPFLAPTAARLAREEQAAGRSAEAEAVLRAALAADPRAWPALLGLGRLFLETGRAAEAVAPLEAAVERAEDPTPALAQLAKAYAGLGRLDEARALLARLRQVPGR
ncbi:MAG: tetratricopeptide repeat protein [Anaeromyxobacteraceae bacterium]